MDKIQLESLSFDKMLTLYDVLTKLCQDFTNDVNSYAIATGDNSFVNLPPEMQKLINERQQIFSFRERLKNYIKNQILNLYE